LNNANKLRGKPFGIREQFPFEIEQRQRILYPIMKDAKRTNQQVALVRDRLYINNELYVPRIGVIPTDEDYENTKPIRSMRTGKSTKQPDIEFKELFNFFKELNTLKETNEPENTLNIDPTITAELNENINSPITKDEIFKGIKTNLKTIKPLAMTKLSMNI
jgi:hypothetical protein